MRAVHSPRSSVGCASRRVACLTALLLAGCSRAPRAADETDRLELVDVAAEAGIDVVVLCGDERRWYIPESNGSGAAWIDHDGDGDLDLFVANGSRMRYHEDGARLEVLHDGVSRLYRNDGGLRFTDVSVAAGADRRNWVNGVATGDVDRDGDTDLYLACFGEDVLLLNEGGRFVEATAESGLGNARWGASAAFGDVDGDGWLDLYVANYCEFDPEAPPLGGARDLVPNDEGIEFSWGPEGENPHGVNAGAPDVFFRGVGGGRFVEATAESGFALEKSLCSYGVAFVDIDADGDQDVLVANDAQPSNLFMNEGGGKFVERGVERGFALDAAGATTAGMGLAVDDFDGDGDFDVLRTHFDLEANGLYVNDGTGRFRERAAAFGLAAPSVDRLSWGAAFLDVELDGDLDLIVSNGHVYPRGDLLGMHAWAQASQLFTAERDASGRLTYRDASVESGPGLGPLRSSRGLAIGDPDDDGDLDVLLVDLDHAPRLLENRSARRGHWIGVRTVGTRSNRDGYGARVEVHAGGRSWVRASRTSSGLYSAHDPRVHFGLGLVTAVDRIEVRWPSGAWSVLEGPELDTYVTITEPEARAR